MVMVQDLAAPKIAMQLASSVHHLRSTAFRDYTGGFFA